MRTSRSILPPLMLSQAGPSTSTAPSRAVAWPSPSLPTASTSAPTPLGSAARCGGAMTVSFSSATLVDGSRPTSVAGTAGASGQYRLVGLRSRETLLGRDEVVVAPDQRADVAAPAPGDGGHHRRGVAHPRLQGVREVGQRVGHGGKLLFAHGLNVGARPAPRYRLDGRGCARPSGEFRPAGIGTARCRARPGRPATAPCPGCAKR